MNAEQLAARLAQAERELANPKGALDPIGSLTVRAARAHTPVKTGTLRESLTHYVQGPALHVGSSVEYAGFVHDGTRYMAARPFITQGITESLNEIERTAQQWADDVLGKVGGL